MIRLRNQSIRIWLAQLAVTVMQTTSDKYSVNESHVRVTCNTICVFLQWNSIVLSSIQLKSFRFQHFSPKALWMDQCSGNSPIAKLGCSVRFWLHYQFYWCQYRTRSSPMCLHSPFSTVSLYQTHLHRAFKFQMHFFSWLQASARE